MIFFDLLLVSYIFYFFKNILLLLKNKQSEYIPIIHDIPSNIELLKISIKMNYLTFKLSIYSLY